MSRSVRLVRLAVTILLAFLVLPPLPSLRMTGSKAGAAEAPKTMVLNFRGTASRQESAPQRFVYTAPLYDMANGEQVGTATADVEFTSPLTLDHVITFHLPDGDLVNHGVEAIGPDPTRQGHFLIGVHPDGDSIMPGKGTGAYAGRTGRVTMSGWHDGGRFPEQITFNDFSLIELNPKAEVKGEGTIHD